MRIAAITPTRGDRPQFVNHCRYLIEQQTVKVDKHYFIDYEPENGDFDLVARVKHGLALAKADKIDFVFIIEDDDFYHNTYIEETLKQVAQNPNKSIFGYHHTIYYNLRLQKAKTLIHLSHSSLFLTSFKINSLNNYGWPSDDYINLDSHLWQYACNTEKAKIIHELTRCIGIKHGVGKCGGNGHKPDFYEYSQLSLKELYVCDNKTVKFYQQFME